MILTPVDRGRAYCQYSLHERHNPRSKGQALTPVACAVLELSGDKLSFNVTQSNGVMETFALKVYICYTCLVALGTDRS